MRRLLASSLIITVLLFVITLAGMAVFGMQANMDMGSQACTGATCAPMTDAGRTNDMAGLDCINHCLAAAVVPMINTPPLVIAFALVLFAVLIFGRTTVEIGAREFFLRRREGIGKHLLHQNLSTIVLRN
jgi:hypothetical protein